MTAAIAVLALLTGAGAYAASKRYPAFENQSSSLSTFSRMVIDRDGLRLAAPSD